jgi:hypothetical protein
VASTATGHAAEKPNPALKDLGIFIGEWQTTGTHPMLPGVTLHGRASFEWLSGGAFLLMRTEAEHPDIPNAVAVISRDDAAETYTVLYFDERGVARIYQMSLHGSVWKLWRDAPGFAQRFTGTFSEDGNSIDSRGELSRDGSIWQPDLELTYTRSAITP